VNNDFWPFTRSALYLCNFNDWGHIKILTMCLGYIVITFDL